MPEITASFPARARSPRTAASIVEKALEARTVEDAEEIAELIFADIGAEYERPIGDRTHNLGLLSSQGSFDHKLLELVINGQDAVVELLALQRFGSEEHVPFQSPQEAARKLLGSLGAEEQAERVRVDIYESDPPARVSKRVTPVVRDFGCGLTPGYVPRSVFYVGSQHKDEALWLQGAFGMGGALTYRNARAVVLVSRRHPDLLLPGEEDRICVAVCRWRQHRKGQGLFYPVVVPWPDEADAEPWSVLAEAYPEFAPGTHIALSSYATQGFYHGRNDRRGFEFMINTRLWEPVFPVKFYNRVARGDHEKAARGLKWRFEDNKRPDRREGVDRMPFRVGGKTYQLPVSYVYFEAGPSADVGGMRNFVYGDHAVMFVSNGQCHRHWTPQEFRIKISRLNKLYDRLLVVVDADELPVELRTTLFTPDRSGFVNVDDARRLEDHLAEFLKDWDELRDLNNEVALKALESRNDGRPTLEVARKIARALRFRGGFDLTGGGNNGGRRRRKKYAPADLWPDPTTLEGPVRVEVLAGETRFLHYHLNAVDEFFTSGRGRLEVVCDHPRIRPDEISVGPLRGGDVRVSIVVPDDVEPGETRLVASVRDWVKAAGGIGAEHLWATELVLLDERPERKPQRPKSEGPTHKPDEGPLVALLWRGPEEIEGWHPAVPGQVENYSAEVLAEASEEYGELAKFGDRDIPTILLNREYAPLKKYVAGRLLAEERDLSARRVDHARDRYAVGAGLGLLLHQQELDRRRKAGEQVSERAELAERQAIARTALAMMPEYDALARELGAGE